MQGNSRLPDNMLASQGGICSMVFCSNTTRSMDTSVSCDFLLSSVGRGLDMGQTPSKFYYHTFTNSMKEDPGLFSFQGP